MTDQKMINAYCREIEAMGGELPAIWGRENAMKIAKLQDVWRRLA